MKLVLLKDIQIDNKEDYLKDDNIKDLINIVNNQSIKDKEDHTLNYYNKICQKRYERDDKYLCEYCNYEVKNYNLKRHISTKKHQNNINK